MRYLAALAALSAFAQSGPVLDTSRSPQAVLHPVPVSAVTLHDGFWAARRKVNVDVSLPSLKELFEQKGILDNFRRLAGKDVARRGPLYTDSDVYKWLEAVAFVLESGPNPELKRSAEAVIADIRAAQETSGYINTWFTREHLADRHQNMRHGHELYCAGHLIQAGIAWQRATGETTLLDVGRRMADYLLLNFGPNKKPIFEGHPEMELALVELYRATGEKKYLDFAGYLLGGDERNLKTLSKNDLVYLFTGKPFTDRTRLEGHAVRAMYASSGAADYFLETGDARYRATLDTLWQDMARRKMYLTGGVGSRASGEAFGEPYELPNAQAYTESCAAIATMFFNWRLAQARADGAYLDLFERALYNGANSGLSLAGNLYCYRNPLELTGNPDDVIRKPWYDTTCCPPNLQRILASLPGYFYSTSKDGLYVHLYDNNSLRWKLDDGTALAVEMKTSYPWQGAVTLTLQPEKTREFALRLRVPSFSSKTSFLVNGAAIQPAVEHGYAVLKRAWKPGDRVEMRLDVQPKLVESNPLVRENVGRVAVERGPLVYCMESLDQPGSTNVFEWTLRLANGQPAFTEKWEPALLGGVMTLRHAATRPEASYADQTLYRPRAAARTGAVPGAVPGEVVLIPYYTFHNRGITAMQVWTPAR